MERQTLPEYGNHIKSHEQAGGLYLKSADI
jgi:hypothetical protein